MRRIAFSLSAVGITLVVGFLIAKNFLSPHSDLNLAELGLSSDPQQIVAPEDPEPASAADSGPSANHSEDLSYGPRLLNGKSQVIELEPNLLPASFIDTAGTAALDSTAFRWMPLCGEAVGSDPAMNRPPDQMPRCDDSTLKSLLQNKAKPR